MTFSGHASGNQLNPRINLRLLAKPRNSWRSQVINPLEIIVFVKG